MIVVVMVVMIVVVMVVVVVVAGRRILDPHIERQDAEAQASTQQKKTKDNAASVRQAIIVQSGTRKGTC